MSALSAKAPRMPKLLTPGVLLPVETGATRAGWHAIEAFTRCPQEHKFSKVMKVVPRSSTVPEHLSIGILFHVARAQWLNDERSGDLWMKAIDKCVAHCAKTRALFPTARHGAFETFKAYVAYWKLRPTTKVLAVEYEIEPRALYPGAPEWAWRGARLDSVEVMDGKAWLGEMKTTSQGVSKVSDTYMLHGQTLLQMALWSNLEEKRFGYPLGGVLLDIVSKPTGKTPAKAYPRVKLLYADAQVALDGWFRRDFTTWVMQSTAITWESRPERRPMCMRQYGPCDYRDLCLHGRDGALKYVFEDTGEGILKWKPEAMKKTPPWE